MEKIKNKHYKKFLKEGIIELITEDQIKQALRNITGQHTKEGRSLLITMYYTGARPIEILNLKAFEITKSGSYVLIKMPASKGGLPRTIHLQFKRPLVKELYKYSRSIFKEMYLFFHYRGKYNRTRQTKSGPVQVIEITDKLRYHIKKWFEGVIDDPIPPYYLRHNRFSLLSELGASERDIRMIKGSRTLESVTPYLHMSTKTSKKLAKWMK